MKKYEQPLMEIDNIVVEDAILSSTSFQVAARHFMVVSAIRFGSIMCVS